MPNGASFSPTRLSQGATDLAEILQVIQNRPRQKPILPEQDVQMLANWGVGINEVAQSCLMSRQAEVANTALMQQVDRLRELGPEGAAVMAQQLGISTPAPEQANNTTPAKALSKGSTDNVENNPDGVNTANHTETYNIHLPPNTPAPSPPSPAPAPAPAAPGGQSWLWPLLAAIGLGGTALAISLWPKPTPVTPTTNPPVQFPGYDIGTHDVFPDKKAH